MQVFSTGLTGTIGSSMPGDVLDLNLRLELPLKPQLRRVKLEGSAIVHLAGVVGVQQIEDNPRAFEINVSKVLELGAIALDAGVSKFVFASTSHVYAASTGQLNESSLTAPKSNYGAQKLEAELSLLDVFANAPEKLAIGRIFSILDWGMPEYSLGGVLSRILGGEKDVLVRNSCDVRDFLSRKNVSSALVMLARSQTSHNIYNVCSGKGQTVQTAILRYLETSGKSFYNPIFLDENSNMPYVVGDNSRLLSEFPDLDLDWLSIS